MVKVKALYHFLDRRACRNRRQGEIFIAPDDWAKELIKAGLAESLEPKKEQPKKTESKKSTKKEKK